MSLREELRAIYDANGRLTPPLVVAAWTDPKHPYHSHLEWNDKVAGPQWRLHQASELIRSVKIVYRKPDTDERIEVRAFHSVSDLGPSYEPIEKVQDDALLKVIILRDAERDWKDLHARYKHLQEFLDLVAADLAAAA